MWTILKLIEWTIDFFTKHSIPNPRLDAELLLSHILNIRRIDLYLSFDKTVPENELALFKGCIQRRIKREPLQYIIGSQDFFGVSIKVTPDVLIPRPETEILVEEVLKHCHSEAEGRRISCNQLSSGDPSPSAQDDMAATHILDLCTGSGCIIAALADKLPEANFVGIDISEKALEIARQNIFKWKDRVRLLNGNLFEPLVCHSEQSEESPSFDIIVSNPPYVAESEWPTLQPEIRDYEPKNALIAGADGLAIIREIIDNAHRFLKPAGLLAMEIGDGQADAVKKIIADNGHYNEVNIIKDYGGLERILLVSTFVR
jgi:release factor glutamine methyltransferase